MFTVQKIDVNAFVTKSNAKRFWIYLDTNEGKYAWSDSGFHKSEPEIAEHNGNLYDREEVARHYIYALNQAREFKAGRLELKECSW